MDNLLTLDSVNPDEVELSSIQDTRAIAYPAKEPLVVREELVVKFKYWLDEELQEGMRFRQELYRYLSRFEGLRRQQAFDLMWQSAQAGWEVVMTATDSHYTVWQSLRSP